MTKTKRYMVDAIKRVDAVIELLDARIPQSSRNPDVQALCGGKPRLVLLNRAAQADPALTGAWKAHFLAENAGDSAGDGGKVAVCEADCRTNAGLKELPGAIDKLLADKLASYAAKGQTGRSLRLMVVGVPNVGKSTFINKLSGRQAAKTEDRPGVTRAAQWVTVRRGGGGAAGLELLDTPGILWPKFEDERTGLHLAFTGAIRDQVLDMETLAAKLCETLAELYPLRLPERYKIAPGAGGDGYALLEAIGRRRGFLVSGGEVDLERAANIVLDEFRGGLLGRVTLEKPDARGV